MSDINYLFIIYCHFNRFIMKKRLQFIGGLMIIVISLLCISRLMDRDMAFESNVEALSLIEEGEPGTGDCIKRIDTTIENQLVLPCGSCIFIKGGPLLPFPGHGTC